MLKYLKISGTPYDAGLVLGRYGRDAVHRHLIHSPAWHEIMRWRNSEKVARMEALVRERHPACWQELAGMAQGLELPLDEVFLWNCRGDVRAMTPDGCTTVLLPGKDMRRLVHNEDGDPGFAGQCAIAEMDVGGVKFASFVYPGSIPGHTIAVTDSGLAMTVNNLRGLHVDAGVPRMVLVRALLDEPDLAGATRLLNESPRAGGFHLTLAHRDSGDLLSVEFIDTHCSIQVVAAPLLHANHMIHRALRDRPQIITGSSGWRQIVGDQLVADSPDPASDALAILRNQDNRNFPIYRETSNDCDHENTLATADICVSQNRIEWQVYSSRNGPPQFHMIDGRRAEKQD